QVVSCCGAASPGAHDHRSPFIRMSSGSVGTCAAEGSAALAPGITTLVISSVSVTAKLNSQESQGVMRFIRAHPFVSERKLPLGHDDVFHHTRINGLLADSFPLADLRSTCFS